MGKGDGEVRLGWGYGQDLVLSSSPGTNGTPSSLVQFTEDHQQHPRTYGGGGLWWGLARSLMTGYYYLRCGHRHLVTMLCLRLPTV